MDIKIHGEIGGWWDGVSAKDVMAQLSAAPKGEEVNVSIHSYGGDMMDGLAIHNALKMHDAKVIVTVKGMAASAASIIAMAGDEIRIPENAYLMIHNPWGYVVGESKDFADAAELFTHFEEVSARVYARRSGKTVEEIKAMQDKATWLDGAQAVEMGFADVMTDAVQIAAFARVPKCLADNCPVVFAEATPDVSGDTDPENAPKAEPPAEPPTEPTEPPAEPQEQPQEPAAEPSAADLNAEAAAEIVELCQLAKKPALAAGFIRDGKTPVQVRALLMEGMINGQAAVGDGNPAPQGVTEQLHALAKTNMTIKGYLDNGNVEAAMKHLEKINNKRSK